MEIVGFSKRWAVKLIAAALDLTTLSPADRKQAEDHLRRLLGTSQKATLDKPTGTAEVIDIHEEIHKASSVSASPTWSVSRG